MLAGAEVFRARPGQGSRSGFSVSSTSAESVAPGWTSTVTAPDSFSVVTFSSTVPAGTENARNRLKGTIRVAADVDTHVGSTAPVLPEPFSQLGEADVFPIQRDTTSR